MRIADYLKTGILGWPNWINLILLRLNVFGPLAYGPSYMKFKRHINEINAEEALINMVNNAIAHVPYYREKYGNLKIRSKKDFEEKIGFIDKDEVLQHWESFIVDGIDRSLVKEETTGGTSGKPLKLLIPQNRYIFSLAYWHKEIEQYGWKYNARGVIRNHHLPEGRVFQINPILKEFIFDPFRMNDVYAKEVWKTLKKYNIHYMHCYPSAMFQFCKLCYNQNLNLDIIKVCFLASEEVTEEQRFFIENKLGIKIYSFYGHSEKLIFAGSTPDDQHYKIENSYGLCELVQGSSIVKEPGVVGEMVGTTLHNPYFPLIRYRTGDYAEYVCSKDGLRLGNVSGRWDKSQIIKKDGSKISTASINLHSSLYEHIDGIQYIQEIEGYIKVLIIKNNKFSDQDEKELLQHLGCAMGGKEFVEICYVDKLVRLSNGKFLPLIQKIQK